MPIRDPLAPKLVPLKGGSRDCVWCWRDQQRARVRGVPSGLRRKATTAVQQPVDAKNADLELCRLHLVEWKEQHARSIRPWRPR